MPNLHIDFVDFEELLADVRLELPGVLDSTIRDIASKVVAEFCQETTCFRERIDLVPGSTSYELYSPHEDAIVVGVESIKAGRDTLQPGDYALPVPEFIELAEPLDTEAVVTVLLKPNENATRIPATIFNRWRSVFAKGVKARLMLQSNVPWSNLQAGMAYKADYDRDVRSAAADVRNEFSVTRKGRTPFKQSNYW